MSPRFPELLQFGEITPGGNQPTSSAATRLSSVAAFFFTENKLRRTGEYRDTQRTGGSHSTGSSAERTASICASVTPHSRRNALTRSFVVAPGYLASIARNRSMHFSWTNEERAV